MIRWGDLRDQVSVLTTGWVMKRWREGNHPMGGSWEDADGEVEGAVMGGLGESELIVGL